MFTRSWTLITNRPKYRFQQYPEQNEGMEGKSASFNPKYRKVPKRTSFPGRGSRLLSRLPNGTGYLMGCSSGREVSSVVHKTFSASPTKICPLFLP